MPLIPLILITIVLPPITSLVMRFLRLEFFTPLVLYAYAIALLVAGEPYLGIAALIYISWIVFKSD